jgi:hypothetical protein
MFGLKAQAASAVASMIAAQNTNNGSGCERRWAGMRSGSGSSPIQSRLFWRRDASRSVSEKLIARYSFA